MSGLFLFLGQSALDEFKAFADKNQDAALIYTICVILKNNTDYILQK